MGRLTLTQLSVKASQLSFLDKAEKRIEASVGSLFAKLSKAELQPVELTQSVRATMDQAASALGRDRVLVPHRYKALVSNHDVSKLNPGILSAVKLEVAKHAQKQGYRLTGELELSVQADPKIARGQVKVGYSAVEQSVSWQPAIVFDGKRHDLKVGSTTVGRDESSDIAIDDRGLSRVHFEIAWNGEVAAIRDRQSTNGTFVDGQRISEVVLRPGSKIAAGRTEFEFEL
ncbi:MAG: hypothetical protein RL418_470, partial [Actinomycetota bacterium]